MKIKRIKLENINSLRGVHEIHFDKNPLENSRLFAITGPTGSGKSTLLDVITLALFNQIPRFQTKLTKKIISEMGAVMTRNTRHAMAEVEYECDRGVYTSRWVIEYNRNNNLKEYEMQLSNSSGEIIPLRKSEVPGVNEEYIGLNYEQFIKSILLAQGDFAEFLKADKRERGELLERITGTGIYRTIGIRAFEKNKEFGEQLKNLQNRLQHEQERKLSEDQVQLLEEERSVLVELEKKCDVEIHSLTKKREYVESKARLEVEIEKNERLIKEWNEKSVAFENQNRMVLDKHRRTAPFAEQLLKYDDATKEIKRYSEEMENCKLQWADVNRAMESDTSEIQKLINSSKQGEKLLLELEQFRSRVVELQQQQKEKRAEFAAQQQRVKDLLSGEKFQLTKDPEADLGELNTLKSELETSIQNRKVEFGWEKVEVNTELEKLSQLKHKILKADGFLKAIRNAEHEVEKKSERVETYKSERASIPQKIEHISKEIKDLEQRIELFEVKIENAQLRTSLEQHRKLLKHGEPCPLCGSVHHPLGSGDFQDTDLEDMRGVLKKMRIEKSEADKKLVETELRKENLEEMLAKLGVEINEHRKRLEGEKAELKKIFPNMDQIDDWGAYADEINEKLRLLTELREWEVLMTKYKSAIEPLNVMGEIYRKGSEISLELSKLYNGDNIDEEVSTLSNRLRSEMVRSAELEARKKQIEKNFQAAEVLKMKIKRTLEKDIVGAGFKGIEELSEARMPEEEFLRLMEIGDGLKSKLKETATEGKNLRAQWKEIADKLGDTDVEKLNISLEEKKREKALIREKSEKIGQDLRLDREVNFNIKTLTEQIKREGSTARKWQLLNQFIGDAKGSRFNQFAQDLTLQQLLVLGNHRLTKLTDRYRIAKPLADEDDALVVIDDHMGGQRRSVMTLSGGETFLLSLSLALALSDLASRNIEINSLFIDEGFGTLDPETLDQTLDTLERLQAEGDKTIGIISHVDALKERIRTQIRLDRNGRGYSTLEVVG